MNNANQTPPSLICDGCGKACEELSQRADFPGVMKNGVYVAPMLCDGCVPPECPSDCTNADLGTCPRCFERTGLGCNHGPLCDDCQQETLHEALDRASLTPNPEKR